MKKLLFILLIITTLASCVVGDLTGLTSGYKHLSPAEKGKIVTLADDASIAELAKSDTIYRMTSHPLKNYLKAVKGEVVLYFWSPNCASSVCYSLESVQELCTQRHQKLIVFTEYFDLPQIEAQKLAALDFPLFSIHAEFYKTDFCDKYVKRFLADLLNMKKVPDDVLYNRYFLFSDSKFINSVNDISTD